MPTLQTLQLDRTDAPSTYNTTTNSTLSRQLPREIPKGTKIAFQKVTVTNSFPNVKTALSFTYTFPGNSTDYTVTIPANTNVSISDINGMLQATMLTNGHYLIDSAGKNVFFVSIEAASVYYGLAMRFTGVPNTLPASYTAPSGWSFPVVNNTVFKINIGNADLQALIGYAAGSYPSASTGSQIVLNTSVPNFNPYGTVYITTNLVNNIYNSLSFGNVIGSFSINSAYGAEISYEPRNALFVDCQSLQTVKVALVDEKGAAIPMIEKGFSCSFALQLP